MAEGVGPREVNITTGSAHSLNEFQGFKKEEQVESKIFVRLSNIEKDNDKMREEMREIVRLVKGIRMEYSEDVTPQTSIIMEELRDIKAREKEREKENKELRDQVERLLEQNNKNRQEINALYEENQVLRIIFGGEGS